MADAQSFAPRSLARLAMAAFLFASLSATAANPAFAQQQRPEAPRLKLHSGDLAGDPGKLDRSTGARRGPVIGSLFHDDRAAVPAWTLPLGALEALRFGANDRGHRGLSFGIRPSRGLKGSAKLRF